MFGAEIFSIIILMYLSFYVCRAFSNTFLVLIYIHFPCTDLFTKWRRALCGGSLVQWYELNITLEGKFSTIW